MQHPTVPPENRASARGLILAAGIICAIATVLGLAGLDISDILKPIMLIIISIHPDQDTGGTRQGEHDKDDQPS
jgi:hypothetical protein